MCACLNSMIGSLRFMVWRTIGWTCVKQTAIFYELFKFRVGLLPYNVSVNTKAWTYSDPFYLVSPSTDRHCPIPHSTNCWACQKTHRSLSLGHHGLHNSSSHSALNPEKMNFRQREARSGGNNRHAHSYIYQHGGVRLPLDRQTNRQTWGEGVGCSLTLPTDGERPFVPDIQTDREGSR